MDRGDSNAMCVASGLGRLVLAVTSVFITVDGKRSYGARYPTDQLRGGEMSPNKMQIKILNVWLRSFVVYFPWQLMRHYCQIGT